MDSAEVRYPDVTVKLTGGDGNVFAIIGAVTAAVKRAHGPEASQEWSRAAMSQPSYDDVLRLATSTVNVE